jgi:hypothetical protein
MLIILAIEEAEIRRMEVEGQLRQTVCKTPISTSKKAGHGGTYLLSQLWNEV